MPDFPGTPHGLPSRHVLRAALRLLRCLGTPDIPRVQLHTAYPLLPTDGVFSVPDFIAAEKTLVNYSVIELRGERVVATSEALAIASYEESTAIELLLSRIMNGAEFPWLSAAARGEELRSEFIPDTELVALTSVFPDPAAREAFLLSVGTRFDAAAAKTLGDAGEEFVVRRCREILVGAGKPELADRVQRVSLVSDTLGYDIVCPTVSGDIARLEVKTTGENRADISCFLSRNEAIVASRDPRWRLVVCYCSADGAFQVTGWCGVGAFVSDLPRDSSTRGRWTSSRLVLQRELVTSDLKQLLAG